MTRTAMNRAILLLHGWMTSHPPTAFCEPVMRRASLLLIFLLTPMVAACPGNDGTLMNELADSTDFITESMTVYYSTNLGYHQVDIDGSDGGTILGWDRVGVEHSFTLKEVSRDLSLWVYNDSETNLFFQYGTGEELHRVPELDRRLSNVAIHPEGGLVVVSRHADFSLPTSQQVDDDRLYLIDAATREVTILPEESDQRISRMFWDEAGEHLYLDYSNPSRFVRVDTESGERVEIPELPEYRRWRRFQHECPSTGQRLEHDDEGIYVVAADGETREQIVFIDGRERGFHDYLSTVGGAHFSDSCAYVIFLFSSRLYVVDVQTQLTAVLVEEGVRSLFLIQDESSPVEDR